MTVITGLLALVVLIALLVVQFGGAIGALFLGRKLPWIWFALAVLETVSKLLTIALYQETDAVRGVLGLAGGLLAAVLALLLQRRHQRIVLVLGGLLAASLIIVQVLGPLLNPAPNWLVLALIGAGGIAGAVWALNNRATATIVLSALVGAGVLTDNLIEPLGVDEAHRFQVYVLLALAGIGFQLWRERRQRKGASPQAQGAPLYRNPADCANPASSQAQGAQA